MGIENFEKQSSPSEEERERIKKSGRRGFIKGAIGAGTVGALSHLDNKMEKAKNVFSFINNAFKRLGDKGEKENINKDSDIEINNIADHYLKAFETLKMREDFFPKKIFTRNLLIAQQLQESDFKKTAISNAGAIGVMQNMNISIKDVSLMLESLNKDGVIEYSGPIYIKHPNKDQKSKYNNRLLTKTNLDELELFRMHNPDYSKALGKLYLMRLWNDKYGYGAGQDEYADGDTKGAQTEILGAYNAGYSRVKNKPIEKWLPEPRTYVKRIFNYVERLKNIRHAMEESGVNPKNDSIAMRIAREMDKVRSKGSERKEILDKTMNHIIQIIKEEQKEKGRELNDQEIIKVFSNFKNTRDITDKLFYT